MSLILEIKTTEKGTSIKQLAGDYKKQVKGMERQADKSHRNIGASLKKMQAGYLAVIGAVGGVVAGLVSAINSTATHRDEIAKLSKATGVAVETLSAYQFVAERSGTSSEAVARGLGRLSRNMNDASDGLKTYTRAFDAINVQYQDSQGNLRRAEDVILDIAEAFKEEENATKKAAIAQQLFGRSGIELVPMLNAGKEGIQELITEAERLGIVFDKEAAEQAEAYADAMTNFKTALQGVKEQLASGLLNDLTVLMNLFTGSTPSEITQIAVLEEKIQQIDDHLANWKPLDSVFYSKNALKQERAQLQFSLDILRSTRQERDAMAGTTGTDGRAGEAAAVNDVLTVEKALAALRQNAHTENIKNQAENIFALEQIENKYTDFNELIETSISDTGDLNAALRGIPGLVGEMEMPWHEVRVQVEGTHQLVQALDSAIQSALVDNIWNAVTGAQTLQDTLANTTRLFVEMGTRSAISELISMIPGGGIIGGIGRMLGFAGGGHFITQGPTPIMVGDNPGGREEVIVRPLSSGETVNNTSNSTFNINIQTDRMDDEFVRTRLIPMLEREQRLAQ
jgi:hypothetical protein